MSLLPFLPRVFAQAMPVPINFRERAVLELDGFPEYAAEVTAEQKARIDELAKDIIRSNDTSDPIFEFRVEGHADIARRIGDLRERKAQEEAISSERAIVGKELLEAALKKHGGDALAHKITRGSRAFGLGTKHLKISNASTEAEFRRNRRVVFIVRQVTFLPPAPTQPEKPTSVVEERFKAQLIKSALITKSIVSGGPFSVDGVVLTATIDITDKIDRKTARFSVLAGGAGVSASPIPAGASLTFNKGAEVDFKIFRLLGRLAAQISLNSFVGGVTVMVDPSGGVGPAATSRRGTLNFSFDALEAAGVNHIPGVIPLPGGNSSLGSPGFSAPIVLPLGRMSMTGSIQGF